eukprot:m.115965 g.115965  ORF g.115965 m.115965 type:complete len:259 (+) comp13116_c0_seq4:579-1355(+)
MSFLRTESSLLTKTTRLSSTCTLSNLQRLTSPHRANPPLGALWLVDSQLDSLAILTNAVREQALKSTVTASEVTLKLTKRGGVACLAIIIGMTTVTGMARPVTQAVPVSLVEMEELNELQHPDLGIPDVNLYLPNVKVMRSIVERMKALSDAMIISANRDGEAVFKVETALVSVKTYFRNLEEPHLKDGETAPPSRTAASDFVDASVLVKSVHQYLSAHQQDPGRVLMSITPGRGVVLHCVQTDATFTFYIPTKAAPG